MYPTSDIDLWSDEVLVDPYPHYRTLRDAGPAVFMERWGIWALARYEDIRAGLSDWETFGSAEGVGLTDAMNTATRGTVLASDPPDHTRLRRVLGERLAPLAMRALTEDLERRADRLVANLVERREFDAVADLARAFPLSVVVELIGLPEEGRDRLLAWADGAFNAFGPDNERTASGVPLLEEQFEYLFTVATPDRLEPGGMGRAIYEAAERGDIAPESCVPLMSAYTTAGIDTTVNAIANAVWLFARHPEQWHALRHDHSLIPAAFNEVLRYDAPVQAFARQTRSACEFEDGVTIPEAQRVVMLYGSGNRDERKFPDPDAFDVTRNPKGHLSFGFGVHACAGQALARVEAHAVLKALARRVERYEVLGSRRHLNNMVRGLAGLRVVVEPA